jgi:aspartyl-tRNA(Asn)/glutamyl-tRNA(Gln) amidotransferase subunit C
MITQKEVEHIAKLARLGLSKKELGNFQKELSSILDFVKKLHGADTSKVEPVSHITGAKNVVRNDKSKKIDIERVKKILKEVPEVKEGYIKVKAVL